MRRDCVNPNSSSMADPSSNLKPYVPPNQRRTSRDRKKSGDRTTSQQSKDGEKSQPLDTGFQMERSSRKIVTVNNLSEAYQLLSQRWVAAMHQYNDPSVDLSERPIMYYGGSVWGKLPHQILATANKTLLPRSMSSAEYITEVRRGLLTLR